MRAIESPASWAGKAYHYTDVRPTTGGNLERPDLFQATCTGAIEGVYLMGSIGLVGGCLSAATGTLVRQKGGNRFLAALVG